ncbi:hypothetical protein [Paraflavitalea sp. CAU 1676]|uniref:hypothetical protein n=1 Tax=Paraflavitalea sp. CAU 1676 TaxID=3032598 RepID=UPI0023DBA297|nr:hypothetical protein [Paraflavitalea sp. CAU 1676]MDF2193431.1 hypothetical protein [Paraflavitalea sp. CAU 1676]
MEVNSLFGEKFPASEGYKVKIKIRAVTVGEVDYEELFPDPDWWKATGPEM